jgi:hypothetical protein
MFLATAAIGLSCDATSPNDQTPSSPGISSPLAAGLFLTTRYGPEVVFIWRSPQDGRVLADQSQAKRSAAISDAVPVPRAYAFRAAYPNPSTDTINVSYDLPKESVVSVWIVRARFINDGGSDIGTIAGGTINAPLRTAVRTFHWNEVLQPGNIRDIWDRRDDDGVLVAPGFYRVYLRTAGILAWRDVLIYDSTDMLPSDLGKLVHELRDLYP